ncbi:MAG: hypothetical protein IJ358_02025 [Clostridia bacterium]|nr:hypothetical protein [Clostridia bacterium]
MKNEQKPKKDYNKKRLIAEKILISSIVSFALCSGTSIIMSNIHNSHINNLRDEQDKLYG